MADAPTSKPPCLRDDALAVLLRLREAGHVAYFAGGCVRDELMGLRPTDYDVATDAPPQRVRSLFSQTQAVGAAFGVILVRHRKSTIEVATFRSEGRYLDGRRPESVRFTTAEEDARRRDFTINGLFLDPVENRVIDYVGGQQDLAERRLRAIGDPNERFAEDHLRLLRAVRFAARFDLQIEPATASAIRTHAPQLARISPERIADELRRMLAPPTRMQAWEMLWTFALVDVIFRFIGAAEAEDFDAARSVFLKLAPQQPIPFGVALAAGALCYQMQSHRGDVRDLLTRNAFHRAVQACRKALRISNDELEQMQATLSGIEPLLTDTEPTVATMKRFLAQPTAAWSRALLRALREIGQHVDRVDWLNQRLDELATTEVAPAPLITGDDLVAAGMSPGPQFKRILDLVYDAQLEGRIHSRDEALALARSSTD